MLSYFLLKIYLVLYLLKIYLLKGSKDQIPKLNYRFG